MKLAMAQMSMSPDMDENYRKTIHFMKQAEGCELLFFPEIQWTPFFPQYRKAELTEKTGLNPEELSVKSDDPRIGMLCRLCADKRMYLSPNLYIETDGKKYDMSLMINDSGQLLGTSEMVHICQAERFYEKDYYTPAESGFHVYDLPIGKVGVVICFDRHLPESIRSCALQGAELILIPTANVKDEPLELFEWEIRTQAYQNNVFIAMCNRTGKEGMMNFAGESLIVDSEGNRIFKADDKEQLIVCDIDLKQTAASRKRRPYISLRRPDQYEP